MNIPDREFLFGSIFLLSNQLQTLGDRYLQEITLKQWFLLMMLKNAGKDTVSITETAALIRSTRQNVRKMLGALERKGYVSLTPNPQDKRNLSVSLTPQAQQFFVSFENRGNAFLEQLFMHISPEQIGWSRQTFEAFFSNLERMEENHV